MRTLSMIILCIFSHKKLAIQSSIQKSVELCKTKKNRRYLLNIYVSSGHFYHVYSRCQARYECAPLGLHIHLFHRFYFLDIMVCR